MSSCQDALFSERVVRTKVYKKLSFEEQYLVAVKDVLKTGERATNRTGIDTLFKLGLYMKLDMEDGFPLLTTKKVPWKSAFAEMLGFIRGYDNANQFRTLGTKVWDANANQNKQWLNNSNREGQDDLGRIYGVQWRNWKTYIKEYPFPEFIEEIWETEPIDQFRTVYLDLCHKVDNRREIILAWNPGELDQMALPPCHMMMQFGLRDNNSTLDLFVYIRSNDMGLGMPFNMAQYSWLLHVMAQITGNKPGTLHYFAFNYHIYVNHIDALREQLKRIPKAPAQIKIHPECAGLNFLEITPNSIEDWNFIEGYDPYPSIKMEMAV